jgi:hypothetical protein
VAGLILGPVALAMFFALADVYVREYIGLGATTEAESTLS